MKWELPRSSRVNSGQGQVWGCQSASVKESLKQIDCCSPQTSESGVLVIDSVEENTPALDGV